MSRTHAMLKALRSAIIEGDATRSLLPAQDLGQYAGEPCVFTRRPVPERAPDPMVILNPPIAWTEADALVSRRPIWNSQIAVYGRKGEPGTAEDQTRLVEEIADDIQELFHREKFSVRPLGFSVIDIVAGGPIPGPTDDDKTVARLVPIRIRLRRD